MPRNLDMTALRSFVTVAEAGGVTRAAGVLNLTQSAVSMQLKRLEEALDLQLLDRSARTIGLTAQGEQLLGYGRRMIAMNDEIYRKLTAQEFEGELKLGVPHDIIYPTVPRILKQVAADFPRMRVRLMSGKLDGIDPGFGFGKTLEHNYTILKNLEYFGILNAPLLIGVSRKSMIYKTLNNTPKEALNGTTALHMTALMKGADILRVHDVKEAVEVVELYSTMRL